MFQKKLFVAGFMAICFVLFNLTAAYAQPEAEQEQPSAEVIEELPLIGESKPYTLGKEDILRITVQNQPEFTGRFIIGPDGKIQYSYAGDVTAAGLTKEQLKQVLEERLARFVKVPMINIAIAEYRSKNVYVLGAVRAPGKYPMKGDTVTLRNAIVEAGLPTREAALRRVYVLEADTQPPVYKKIDLFKVLYKGLDNDNVDLFAGDIVVVPSTIPSEINRALSNLLSPFSRARSADILMEHRWGAGDEE